VKAITLNQLNAIWKKVLSDPDASKALATLKKSGFPLTDLCPRDPTFHNPTWADYIAAIPLLPSRSSRRHIHRHGTLQRYRPLVKALRTFEQKVRDPFCEKHLISARNFEIHQLKDLGDVVANAADFIEHFLSWDWYVRDRNPRNALIAELRWTIRNRTGKPHDEDLSTLIDAAFRATGRKELMLDNVTLDQIENREAEGRIKATCRLNYDAGFSPTPGSEFLLRSRRKPKKNQ
jgi:hypothetical protein